MPLLVHAVDWGMDSRLTPGDWEPWFWIKGTFLSGVFVSAFGSPLLLVLPVAVAAGVARRVRRSPACCPSCSRSAAVVDGVCPRCGPVPPRDPAAPRVRIGPIVLETTGLICAHVTLFLTLGLALSSLICWVRLEVEEDSFGRRAREAALRGELYHQERSPRGSELMWSADRGYWSHRD